MEDLLWRYPDDFLPRYGFKPVARQFTLSDGGRLDVSFRDANDRLWVIEVKAVPIRYADAEQVHRYARQLREANPSDPPIPALVSPYINATVSETLVRWAIEPFEITEATFRRVATERGLEMESQPSLATLTTDAMAEGIRQGNKALSSRTIHPPAGKGPRDGWYQLVQFSPCKPENPTKCYCSLHATYHYRRDGETRCLQHKDSTTAGRSNCEYHPAAERPVDAFSVCRRCGRAASEGS